MRGNTPLTPVIFAKIGKSQPLTPQKVVDATAAMTPAQAAQTIQNLGIPMAVYHGVDLTQKFAAEIANYTDEWDWIHARIQAGDYAGININDYIPVVANGNTYKARIMGVDTYTGYGDVEVGHHIDWIFEELWPARKPINPANYNNGLIPVEDVTADGTATTFVLTKEMNQVAKIEAGGSELSGWTYDASTYTITFEAAPAAGTLTVTGIGTEFPWLACDAYHFANSLAGQVPNGTGLNPAVKHVDYTQDGIYYYLPQKLKNVIIQKRVYLPKRYSTSGVLNNSTGGAFANVGYIWFPSEYEVLGSGIWADNGYEKAGTALQYPYFAGNVKRIKRRGSDRDYWWLMNSVYGSSIAVCIVTREGYVNNTNTSQTFVSMPVCFRTA